MVEGPVYGVPRDGLRDAQARNSLDIFLLLADRRSFNFLMGQGLVNSLTEDKTADIQVKFVSLTTSKSPLNPQCEGGIVGKCNNTSLHYRVWRCIA